ncbi:hypothetical protein P691DRAFT_779967 [Macrolepiota fuliginosa MF-IS2]|uniref:Uncharacterized protein n=1 Tax=Macrolepiota fuliginosa MF-IS2 TaxID=1400762 RepID=A0A9P5WXM4_9AGAR|nr:hypothetical protein P691DRAFT_779967 [Macrolepiota fuliginosa MF-IS2]
MENAFLTSKSQPKSSPHPLSNSQWDPTSHQVPDKPNVYDKSTSLVSQFKVPSAKSSVKPKINRSECIAGVKWVEKYGHTSQNKNKDFEAYWHGLMPEERAPFVEEAYQRFLQAIRNSYSSSSKAQVKRKAPKT